MKPHPDFAGAQMPRSAALGPFRLAWLTAADAEEDFRVVMASAALIRGATGSDWPDGLTLAENWIDLAWHEREFTENRSFAWIIRRADRGYAGCAYLYPDIGARGGAEARWWLAAGPDRVEEARAFGPAFRAWLAQVAPSGVALRFATSDP